MKELTATVIVMSCVLGLVNLAALFVVADDLMWLSQFRERMKDVTEVHVFPQGMAAPEQAPMEIR